MKPYIICFMIAPGFDGIKDINRPATKLAFQSVERVGKETVWI